MKRFYTLVLLWMMAFTNLYATDQDTTNTTTTQKPVFYIIHLHQEIDKAAFRLIRDGLQQAQEKQADYCILDMNTYGGAVDAADSIRSMIIQSPVPVIAFINSQAASAGALISIACDSIYMRNGSSIGAATVVNAQGEVMPDKYQSFMRAMMRSTAESHGKKTVTKNGRPVEVWHRDPLIAQAMVNKDSVLSFTPSEAIENGFCEGMAENTNEVIRKVLGEGTSTADVVEYEVVQQQISTLDKVIYFLMNPFLQGLLLMLIIGGIYFELQSPGIGFPLVAAITGAVLYFAPLYLEGLAQNWELILFLIGVGLLVVEIFVIPGFGVAGIGGIILIITGLAFAMIDNDLLVIEGTVNLRPLIKPFAIVLIAMTISLFASIYLAARLFPSKVFSHIALKTDLSKKEGFVGVETDMLQAQVGKNAVVTTDLKPAGTVEIEGKRYQAQINYGFATRGEQVVITRAQEGRLYCDKRKS